MAPRKRFTPRLFRRTAIMLMTCWASGLAVFFANPTWSRAQIDKAYNWLTDRRFEQPKKAQEPCTETETHAWQMNDTVGQYWAHSEAHGIVPLNYIREIDPAVAAGKLVPVVPNDLYILDTMKYSFPFAVPAAKAFLDTIATRFRAKLVNTDLYGVRLLVTSVLRTKSSVARLVRHNRNAIRNSAHLHGTTFDLSYATYDFRRPVTEAEAEYLKEVLALTLFELRAEKKCWVTYELFQTCFHVVSRS